MNDQNLTSNHDASHEHEPARAVTLFVVPNCLLCADARAWLRANGVPFVERDVARDFGALRAMYRLTRQNLVPVFERNGRALVRPSNEELARLCLESC